MLAFEVVVGLTCLRRREREGLDGREVFLFDDAGEFTSGLGAGIGIFAASWDVEGACISWTFIKGAVVTIVFCRICAVCIDARQTATSI